MPGLDPGIRAFLAWGQDVDGRDIWREYGASRLLPGRDDGKSEAADHGTIEIGEKSTNQLFGCTKPLSFGLIARGATS